MGRGRQKGIAEIYRSHVEPGNLLRKVKLEIAVNDDFVSAAITTIARVAKTGNTGDGKIFVLDLAECIRIRTGETGAVATAASRPRPRRRPAAATTAAPPHSGQAIRPAG
jgi:nitrogen regulatory protein P-II 2